MWRSCFHVKIISGRSVEAIVYLINLTAMNSLKIPKSSKGLNFVKFDDATEQKPSDSVFNRKRGTSEQLYSMSPYPPPSPGKKKKPDTELNDFSQDTVEDVSPRNCQTVIERAVLNPLIQFILVVLILSFIFSICLFVYKSKVTNFMRMLGEKSYAPWIFSAVFSVYVTLCFPCTFMEFLAGYIFNFWPSFAACTIGKIVGSCVSYAIAQCLGPQWIREHLLSRYSVWNGLQLAISRKPWTVTFLIRLGYIPLMVKNYGLSVMHCPFHIFLVCSTVAGIPFTLAINHAGLLSKELLLAAEGEKKIRSPWDICMMILGCSAIIMFVLVTRFYTKQQLEMVELQQMEPSNDDVNRKLEDSLSYTNYSSA